MHEHANALKHAPNTHTHSLTQRLRSQGNPNGFNVKSPLHLSSLHTSLFHTSPPSLSSSISLSLHLSFSLALPPDLNLSLLPFLSKPRSLCLSLLSSLVPSLALCFYLCVGGVGVVDPLACACRTPWVHLVHLSVRPNDLLSAWRPVR